MATYRLGAGDPPLSHDPGAGPWNSKAKELTMIALKGQIVQNLGGAVVIVGVDAALHMMHFMGNSGVAYTIRLRNMVDSVPSAKAVYDQELEAARTFAFTLPDGTHNITSSSLSGGYNGKAESSNWYFATGGYSAWGKGVAKLVTAGPTRTLTLEFEYKFYDRYNWDGGKSVTLFGIRITDDFMGEFHRQGLAQEFDCFGSIKDTRTFTAAAPAPPPAPAPSPTPVPPTPTPGPPTPTPGPPAPPAAGGFHIVRAGDSLWKIAQLKYGNGNLWERIYKANRALIGPNPNLIHPGQKLTIP